MVEIECPFCDEVCRVEAAIFTAASFLLRCDRCLVELPLGEESRSDLALAA